MTFLYIDDCLDASWKLFADEGLSGTVLNVESSSQIIMKDLTRSRSDIINVERR
jgi:hypothetical protein